MKKNKPTTRLGGAMALNLGLLGAMLSLGACASGVNTHGNLPDAEVLEEIQPGVHSRDDVLSLLGSPSTISTFKDNRWYYIGSRSETIAFFDPDVLERNVLVVSFNEDGRVGEKRIYNLADSQDVEPVGRITPTEGKKLTIMQQLFGNIGRFTGAGTDERN